MFASETKLSGKSAAKNVIVGGGSAIIISLLTIIPASILMAAGKLGTEAMSTAVLLASFVGGAGGRLLAGTGRTVSPFLCSVITVCGAVIFRLVLALLFTDGPLFGAESITVLSALCLGAVLPSLLTPKRKKHRR